MVRKTFRKFKCLVLETKLRENLAYSRRLGGSLSERIHIFNFLNRLQRRKNQSFEEDKLIKENFYNYTFFSYDYYSINFLFKEVFVSEEYDFVPKTKQPLIIDCGANIGMSVIYFKHKFPNCKILAFEPNPDSYNLLERNVRVNHLKNVEIHNVGLFDKALEIPFYIGNRRASLTGSIRKERGKGKTINIKAEKLSNYIKHFESIDLIKMDVEGAEFHIVEDLVTSSTLNKVKEYIIEYHHNLKQEQSKLSSFLRIFEDHGYNYNLKGNFSEINSFQDVLIHFYKKSDNENILND